MTRLSSLQKNHFSINCWCGHHSLVPVQLFIDRFGADAFVDDVVTKTRCRKCGASLLSSVQIVFVGESLGAMSGAQQKKDETKEREND